MADNKKQGMKLIVTFAERGQGNMLVGLYMKRQVLCHWICKGRGTASSEMLDVLGIGTSERDIIFSVAADNAAGALLRHLNDGLSGSLHAKGIVFDMPLAAMSNLIAAMLLEKSAGIEERGGVAMEPTGNNSLILIVVNQGHTDEVMGTAKEAGAKGGTVLRARWAGTEHIEKFYGITVQEEREIIAIVASAKERNAIMEAVNQKHGLQSQAGAVLCSVGIEHTAKLA